MNERIKELARQAGFNDFPNDVNGVWITDGYWEEELERFAELVRQDEREQAEKQEPVAYKYTDKTNPLVFYFTTHKDSLPNPDVIETALYTAPNMSTKPENIDTSAERVHETDIFIHEDDDIQEYKRPWVGLTNEEIDAIGYKYGAGGLDLMDELSAMLKEKNT
jgi:hypothetical protein